MNSCRLVVSFFCFWCLSLESGWSEQIVYFDRAEAEQRPENFLRSFNASKGWELSSDYAYEGLTSERFLLAPTRNLRHGTLLWDLPAMRFDGMRIRVLVPEEVGRHPFAMSFILNDGAGNGYVMIPYYDKEREVVPMKLRWNPPEVTPLRGDGVWRTYEVRFSKDVLKVIRPQVNKDAPDTQERLPETTFRRVMLAFEVPVGSPLIGQEFYVYVDLLELFFDS